MMGEIECSVGSLTVVYWHIVQRPLLPSGTKLVGLLCVVVEPYVGEEDAGTGFSKLRW